MTTYCYSFDWANLSNEKTPLNSSKHVRQCANDIHSLYLVQASFSNSSSSNNMNSFEFEIQFFFSHLFVEWTQQKLGSFVNKFHKKKIVSFEFVPVQGFPIFNYALNKYAYRWERILSTAQQKDGCIDSADEQHSIMSWQRIYSFCHLICLKCAKTCLVCALHASQLSWSFRIRHHHNQQSSHQYRNPFHIYVICIQQ